MRLLAIFPLLCSIVSFVLAMLCIFAGSKLGYLEDANLLTLNVSLLGEFRFNQSIPSSSSSSNPLISWLNGVGSSIITDIEGDIQTAVDGVIEDIAHALHIHDFYSVHLLDYCEGYYEPSPIANATASPTKNVTHCSSQTSGFTFDPTAILQSELLPGINLSDLKWPSEIQDTIDAVNMATKATFVIYCIGVSFAGLAILGALFAVIGGGRLSALLNFMIASLAFLALGVASALVTAIVAKVVDAINEYGNAVNVEAYQGTTFITWTWVATAMMFLAMITWVVEFCVGRRNQVKGVRNGEKFRA